MMRQVNEQKRETKEMSVREQKRQISEEEVRCGKGRTPLLVEASARAHGQLQIG